MCGIAGILTKKEIPESRFDDFYQSSLLMGHRGPDYCGKQRFGNLMLIHYRLSILDLDPRSHQPFASHDKSYTCVYNGELYNYQDLKYNYQIATSTTSDTEILLESFVLDKANAVKQWNGIFAAAIYNSNEKKLYLIRDRYGVKPLYWYEDDDVILFASEAKVIFDFLPKLEISYDGLAEYLWYGNTVTLRTMIKGVRKIAPASITEIDAQFGLINKSIQYWQNPGTNNDYVPHADEAAKNVAELLEKAVQRQLMSDVPLGVLLSGGVDSSAITAFASKHSQKKLDTYTVEYDYNIGGESELDKAALIANKFNTNHHELKIEAKNIADEFSELVFQYDEPFADAANIPLYELAKVCSKDKRVILQGDGGDEFFAGYRTYNILDWLWFWKPFSTLSYRFIPDRRWAQRMERMSHALNEKTDAKRMALMMTQDVMEQAPYVVLQPLLQHKLSYTEPFNQYQVIDEKYRNESIVQKMLYADVEIQLVHTFLEKVDKATMRCSLEARVPFLDNELTDYALALPSDLKVKKGEKKYLLKKALSGIVPDEILYGKKRGFDVPYREWLRKDLYDMAIEVFSKPSISKWLNKEVVIDLLNKHRAHVTDNGSILWKTLVLAAWLDKYSSKIKS